MLKPISRLQFLRGLAACTITAAFGKYCLDAVRFRREIPCRLLGPSRELGHRLREKNPSGEVKVVFATATKVNKKVVIVGGGIAGLSAAWWLQRQGITDFLVLELEDHPGGNSSSGKNQFSAYPWGAHYVPLANPESAYVRQLFEEVGVIREFNAAGQPVYDELYLCHDPQERLFKDGSFQEGLVPKRGLQLEEKEQFSRFHDLIVNLRGAVGADGRPAFAIPIDLSSSDEKFRCLDRVSMASWLKENGFSCKPLLWYVNYCCRDDYGSTSDNVSAWAGLHYFAGRRGTAANAEPNAVVTWPEGNGFLVQKLKDTLGARIQTNMLVSNVHRLSEHDPADKRAAVLATDTKTGTNKLFIADYVVIAAPRFVASHILPASAATAIVKSLSYAPWMVANITVRKIPQSAGEPLAWDNVSYYSKSLGYVVANHQNVTLEKTPIVITYYYPLSESDPLGARRQLYDAKKDKWLHSIVSDLERMHPGIEEQIESVDLWPWGHGMVRPSVGFIWGEARAKMKEPLGSIYFAHSDMSGISNFEEAQFQGVEAARQILASMEHTA